MTATMIAKKRNQKAEVLRKEGLIPAVVYGPHIDSFSVAVPATVFEKFYEEHGESTLIELQVEGEKAMTVFVKDLQIDPVKRTVSHVDFKHVTEGEEIEVEIGLEFEGVAPAVKELGGTLITAMDTLTVRCLPKDLVETISVDLTALKTFEESIHVRDLKVAEGLNIQDNPDALIAKVTAPLTQEQLEKMEEESTAGSVEDIKVEEKGKKEEEGADAAEKKE